MIGGRVRRLLRGARRTGWAIPRRRPDDGLAGVREPRRPKPKPRSGAGVPEETERSAV
ncbi:MAG: hypothetical protein ACR2F6_11980 [Mycobacteriales bacterium]